MARPSVDIEDVIAGADPRFKENTRGGPNVHDWRSYIYDPLIKVWSTFTPEQKRAIIENADLIADNEHWD